MWSRYYIYRHLELQNEAGQRYLCKILRCKLLSQDLKPGDPAIQLILLVIA